MADQSQEQVVGEKDSNPSSPERVKRHDGDQYSGATDSPIFGQKPVGTLEPKSLGEEEDIARTQIDGLCKVAAPRKELFTKDDSGTTKVPNAHSTLMTQLTDALLPKKKNAMDEIRYYEVNAEVLDMLQGTELLQDNSEGVKDFILAPKAGITATEINDRDKMLDPNLNEGDPDRESLGMRARHSHLLQNMVQDDLNEHWIRISVADGTYFKGKYQNNVSEVLDGVAVHLFLAFGMRVVPIWRMDVEMALTYAPITSGSITDEAVYWGELMLPVLFNTGCAVTETEPYLFKPQYNGKARNTVIYKGITTTAEVGSPVGFLSIVNAKDSVMVPLLECFGEQNVIAAILDQVCVPALDMLPTTDFPEDCTKERAADVLRGVFTTIGFGTEGASKWATSTQHEKRTNRKSLVIYGPVSLEAREVLREAIVSTLCEPIMLGGVSVQLKLMECTEKNAKSANTIINQTLRETSRQVKGLMTAPIDETNFKLAAMGGNFQSNGAHMIFCKAYTSKSIDAKRLYNSIREEFGDIVDTSFFDQHIDFPELKAPHAFKRGFKGLDFPQIDNEDGFLMIKPAQSSKMARVIHFINSEHRDHVGRASRFENAAFSVVGMLKHFYAEFDRKKLDGKLRGEFHEIRNNSKRKLEIRNKERRANSERPSELTPTLFFWGDRDVKAGNQNQERMRRLMSRTGSAGKTATVAKDTGRLTLPERIALKMQQRKAQNEDTQQKKRKAYTKKQRKQEEEEVIAGLVVGIAERALDEQEEDEVAEMAERLLDRATVQGAEIRKQMKIDLATEEARKMTEVSVQFDEHEGDRHSSTKKQRVNEQSDAWPSLPKQQSDMDKAVSEMMAAKSPSASSSSSSSSSSLAAPQLAQTQLDAGWVNNIGRVDNFDGDSLSSAAAASAEPPVVTEKRQRPRTEKGKGKGKGKGAGGGSGSPPRKKVVLDLSGAGNEQNRPSATPPAVFVPENGGSIELRSSVERDARAVISNDSDHSSPGAVVEHVQVVTGTFRENFLDSNSENDNEDGNGSDNSTTTEQDSVAPNALPTIPEGSAGITSAMDNMDVDPKPTTVSNTPQSESIDLAVHFDDHLGESSAVRMITVPKNNIRKRLMNKMHDASSKARNVNTGVGKIDSYGSLIWKTHPP
jgi:hypothetical protein